MRGVKDQDGEGKGPGDQEDPWIFFPAFFPRYSIFPKIGVPVGVVALHPVIRTYISCDIM